MWKLHQEHEENKQNKNHHKEKKDIWKKRLYLLTKHDLQTFHHCHFSLMENLLHLNNKIKHAANILFAMKKEQKKKAELMKRTKIQVSLDWFLEYMWIKKKKNTKPKKPRTIANQFRIKYLHWSSRILPSFRQTSTPNTLSWNLFLWLL